MRWSRANPAPCLKAIPGLFHFYAANLATPWPLRKAMAICFLPPGGHARHAPRENSRIATLVKIPDTGGKNWLQVDQKALIVLFDMPLSPGTSKPSDGKILTKPVWPQRILVAITLIVAVATLPSPPGTTTALDALLLALATVASISAMARQLPLQSVLFAAFITMLIGSAAHGLSARTAIPLGPLSFGEAVGPKLFNTAPWTIGLIWIVAVFNSRGVARLILRPWRKAKNYGFLQIGITAILALVFDLALEPFAHLKHFWLWLPTKIPVTWYGASPVCFLSWTFVVLLILAVITPFLIRKQPGKQSPPDLAPLALWLGALILFGVSAGQAGQWPALVLDSAAAVTVAIMAWRGVKW